MNASRDENNIPTLIAILNSDGTTVTRVKATASSNKLRVLDGITGSDSGPSNAKIDENDIKTLLCVSESDGTTIVPIYVDSNGSLLIDSS